ncbi:hypothetical protein [Alicyclobacillus mali (ex Roth et al. 2021)]
MFYAPFAVKGGERPMFPSLLMCVDFGREMWVRR